MVDNFPRGFDDFGLLDVCKDFQRQDFDEVFCVFDYNDPVRCALAVLLVFRKSQGEGSLFPTYQCLKRKYGSAYVYDRFEIWTMESGLRRLLQENNFELQGPFNLDSLIREWPAEIVEVGEYLLVDSFS